MFILSFNVTEFFCDQLFSFTGQILAHKMQKYNKLNIRILKGDPREAETAKWKIKQLSLALPSQEIFRIHHNTLVQFHVLWFDLAYHLFYSTFHLNLFNFQFQCSFFLELPFLFHICLNSIIFFLFFLSL